MEDSWPILVLTHLGRLVGIILMCYDPLLRFSGLLRTFLGLCSLIISVSYYSLGGFYTTNAIAALLYSGLVLLNLESLSTYRV